MRCCGGLCHVKLTALYVICKAGNAGVAAASDVAHVIHVWGYETAEGAVVQSRVWIKCMHGCHGCRGCRIRKRVLVSENLDADSDLLAYLRS